MIKQNVITHCRMKTLMRDETTLHRNIIILLVLVTLLLLLLLLMSYEALINSVQIKF